MFVWELKTPEAEIKAELEKSGSPIHARSVHQDVKRYMKHYEMSEEEATKKALDMAKAFYSYLTMELEMEFERREREYSGRTKDHVMSVMDDDGWNQTENTDYYYIPVYPTAEEERHGESPVFVGIKSLLHGVTRMYLRKLKDYRKDSIWRNDMVDVEEHRLMLEDYSKLCSRIIEEDLAIPKTLLISLFYEEQEAVEKLLQDENPIRIRHYAPVTFNLSDNGEDSRKILVQNHLKNGTFETDEYCDENEFLYAWNQYKEAKAIGYPISSFEEYLRIWTNSKQRKEWLAKQDQEREEAKRRPC